VFKLLTYALFVVCFVILFIWRLWNVSHVIDAGAFDILVYTDKDLEVPEKWNETGPATIANSQEVKLRSFSTAYHKVDTMVAYKHVDNWFL